MRTNTFFILYHNTCGNIKEASHKTLTYRITAQDLKEMEEYYKHVQIQLQISSKRKIYSVYWALRTLAFLEMELTRKGEK